MAHADTVPNESELIAQWKRDRNLRRRLPLSEAWRGCIGMAMLLDRVGDRCLHHGERVLLDNDHVRWAAIRRDRTSCPTPFAP